MFENIGTALIQAFGFLIIFGFFIYQTLFAESKIEYSQINKKIKKESVNSKNKGLFKRKRESAKEEKITNKNGLFSKKPAITLEEFIQKKKKKKKKEGWFK